MNKNTLIGIGLVVAILTAWLVIAVAMKTNNNSKNVNTTKNTQQSVSTPVDGKVPKDTTTKDQTVETSVDVVSDNVSTELEVK